MKYGVQVSQGWPNLAGIKDPVEAYETMTRVAQTADDYGYETLWLADHLMPTVADKTNKEDMYLFECWTSTAALARDTKRIRLCQETTINGYRNPALLAKMASTVDVLSHGRLTLGVGSGIHAGEFLPYGYEYPDHAKRQQQLQEAVDIILAMWKREEVFYQGEHYQVNGAINEPIGVQRPHIPLLIAGDDEVFTLQLAAQKANACRLGPADVDTIREKLCKLRQHCEAAGRDYGSIWRTATAFCAIGDTDEQALESFSQAWKTHFNMIQLQMKGLLAGDRSLSAFNQWMKAILSGDTSGATAFGLVGSPDTIRKRIALYEAAGVQELRLVFPDVAHLQSIRLFAEEFIL